jgi:hypothetical protein
MSGVAAFGIGLGVGVVADALRLVVHWKWLRGAGRRLLLAEFLVGSVAVPIVFLIVMPSFTLGVVAAIGYLIGGAVVFPVIAPLGYWVTRRRTSQQ